MREADIEELTAVGNVSPETALMSGYLESKPYCYTGMKDGTPFTMFGVVPMDRELKTGSIWLLATNDLTVCTKKIQSILNGYNGLGLLLFVV
jgi:hypothetical protein